MHVRYIKDEKKLQFRTGNSPSTGKPELARERTRVVKETKVNIRWKERKGREKRGGQKLRFVNERKR